MANDRLPALEEIKAASNSGATSLLMRIEDALAKGDDAFAFMLGGPEEVEAAVDGLWVIAGKLDQAVAALDAVLAAHRNSGGRCAWCRNPDGQRQKWPCGEYLAISRALTGEGGTTDQQTETTDGP